MPALRRSCTESTTSPTSASRTGGAVAVGDDQRQVLGRGLGLVVGVDLPVAVAVLDDALRPVGVGRGEHGAHVFEADAVLVERRAD